MNLFEEFKNKTGLRTQDIERETGYTPQGIRYAFEKLETDGTCSGPFRKAMENLIRDEIFRESERHLRRIGELQSMLAKLNQEGEKLC